MRGSQIGKKKQERMLKSKEKKIMLSEKRKQVKIVVDWKTIGSKKVKK